MKIGVFSDTHGSLKWFKRAYSVFKGCDFLLHAGDILYHGPRNPLPEDYNPSKLADFINKIEEGRIEFVRGNCDADVDQMVISHDISLRFKNFRHSKFRIGLLHGDQFKNEDEMIKFSEKFGLNVLVFGHTHKKLLSFERGHLLVNPGSTSLPKDETKSVALLQLGNYTIKVKLIDLESEEVIKEAEFDFRIFM